MAKIHWAPELRFHFSRIQTILVASKIDIRGQELCTVSPGKRNQWQLITAQQAKWKSPPKKG